MSRQGKVRLTKWYAMYSAKEKARITREVTSAVLNRGAKMCNVVEYKETKVVYKRYASLYFVASVNKDDNELIALEIIHQYVEVLDKYFGNVCELDIIFNFHKVRAGERRARDIPEMHAMADADNERRWLSPLMGLLGVGAGQLRRLASIALMKRRRHCYFSSAGLLFWGGGSPPRALISAENLFGGISGLTCLVGASHARPGVAVVGIDVGAAPLFLERSRCSRPCRKMAHAAEARISLMRTLLGFFMNAAGHLCIFKR